MDEEVAYTYDVRGNTTTQTDGNGIPARVCNLEQIPSCRILIRYGLSCRRSVGNKSADGIMDISADIASRVRIVNRDGAESRYAYDDRNNLISVQDERGNSGSYTYDEEDNLITWTDRAGNIWSYAYDEAGHLKEAGDPAGNVSRYVHDASSINTVFLFSRSYVTALSPLPAVFCRITLPYTSYVFVR